jgi:non-canonical (house-cleaning) NTP pyrophosphatase
MNQCVRHYGFAKVVRNENALMFTEHRPELQPVPDSIRVCVCSDKEVKIEAVKELFSLNPRYSSCSITCFGLKTSSGIAEQPIGQENGRKGALSRIESAVQAVSSSEHAEVYFCAVENYFDVTNLGSATDYAYVIVRTLNGTLFESVSLGIQINVNLFYDATHDAENLDSGLSITVGSFLEATYGFNGSDWFTSVLPPNVRMSRKDQIVSTLQRGIWF